MARSGGQVLAAAAEQGVMVLVAGPNVMRFMSLLVIDLEDIDQGMARFARAVEAVVKAP